MLHSSDNKFQSLYRMSCGIIFPTSISVIFLKQGRRIKDKKCQVKYSSMDVDITMTKSDATWFVGHANEISPMHLELTFHRKNDG